MEGIFSENGFKIILFCSLSVGEGETEVENEEEKEAEKSFNPASRARMIFFELDANQVCSLPDFKKVTFKLDF